MSVTSVHQDAFAKDAGMSLTAIAEEDGAIISVSGETTSNLTDVTFRVISPNGQNVVAVDQVAPDANGEFSTQFNVSNWTFLKNIPGDERQPLVLWILDF